MMKMIIDRLEWHRGQSANGSRLVMPERIAPDNKCKKCCLGIYGVRLGHRLEDLNLCTPGDMVCTMIQKDRVDIIGTNPFPGLVLWGIGQYTNNTLSKFMMKVNDEMLNEVTFLSDELAKVVKSVEGLTEYLLDQKMMYTWEEQEAGRARELVIRCEAQREGVLALCFKSIGVEVVYVN